MDSSDYQAAVGRTLRQRKRGLTAWETDLAIAALGLAEEAGEVVRLVMRTVDAGEDLSHEAMVEELGDVQAHVAKLATLVGASLGTTQERNVSKLRARFPEAFPPEAAGGTTVAAHLAKARREAGAAIMHGAECQHCGVRSCVPVGDPALCTTYSAIREGAP